MATNDVQICNMALAHLGVGNTIASLTERSKEATACNLFFEQARNEMLREFVWPFARKFAVLSLVAELDDDDAGGDEWTYSYRYPTDCLYLRRILSGTRNDTRQTRVPYMLGQDSEGKLIYTDTENAEAEYTVLEDDPSRYDPDFVMALSLRLASYIAPRITNGDPFKMGQRSIQLFAMSVAKAQAVATNEEQAEEPPDSEFINARN